MEIRLLLAIHQQLVLDGIAQMLERVSDIGVTATVSDASSAQLALREQDIDVAIVSMGMPPAGGLEIARRLLRVQPRLQVIGLGSNSHGPYPYRFLEAGGRGFITQECSPPEMTKTIRTVALGRRYISTEAAQRLVMDHVGGSGAQVASLSARELAVLVLVSRGKQQAEISALLNISRKTVSTYRSRVCRKLGVKTDVELTHVSLRHGLIEEFA